MSKDKCVKIRLDKKELDLLKFFAKQNNLTVSEYIRKQSLGYTVSYKMPLDVNRGVIKKIKTKE